MRLYLQILGLVAFVAVALGRKYLIVEKFLKSLKEKIKKSKSLQKNDKN